MNSNAKRHAGNCRVHSVRYTNFGWCSAHSCHISGTQSNFSPARAGLCQSHLAWGSPVSISFNNPHRCPPIPSTLSVYTSLLAPLSSLTTAQSSRGFNCCLGLIKLWVDEGNEKNTMFWLKNEETGHWREGFIFIQYTRKKQENTCVFETPLRCWCSMNRCASSA